MPLRILHVVGARPNFMKAAPVLRALRRFPEVNQALVHTGQHYDAAMSEVFFRDLGMPQPHVNLEAGSGSHAQQTALVLSRIEPVLAERRPSLVLVYGDVNSTLAAALACAKLQVPAGHVEAGLRSFDRTMPEETNRVLTDQMAELLFTPSAEADANLHREGVQPHRVYRVGNVMIDSLVRLLPIASSNESFAAALHKAGAAALGSRRYGVVTLHRPSNVDDPAMLAEVLSALADVSRRLPLIFPVHPRTRLRMRQTGIPAGARQLFLCDPLSYVEFLTLQRRATVVITDSGGVQEETTYLGIPCLTLRPNTERPITMSLGTNVLVGDEPARLLLETERILAGQGKRGRVPPLWDGHAAERIAAAIVAWWRTGSERDTATPPPPAQAADAPSSAPAQAIRPTERRAA